MKVLFIVEAGYQAGLGHLMRCRSLLLEMERCGIAADLWVRGEASALDGLKWPDTMDVRVLGDDVPLGGLEKEISAHLERKLYNWIVVDGYGFSGAALYERLTARGARLLMLDDFADRTLKTDVLLNQNTDRTDLYTGNRVQADRLLLGPRYALVSPEYREAHWDAKQHEDLKRVLISFGGVDRHGCTQKVLVHLDGYEQTLDVDVVIGPFYRFDREIRAYCGRHRLAIHQKLTSLADLMRRADVMVSAAGTTVWQACCVGVPLVAIQTQDNQRELYRTLEREGAAVCAQAAVSVDLPPGGEDRFLAMFRRAADPAARRDRSAKARQLVNGNGASRVVDALVSATISQEVKT